MLKAIYLGTPDFSVNPLLKLLERKDLVQVIAVVTNHDKPVGRKQILTACPVKEVALKHGIPVYQYNKIRSEGVEDIRALNPDIMITCAFGQILSQALLDIPKMGVINVHASLLPKYRGASPIHYAILNGESKTGVTIMKTDIGIDTGDMLLSKEISIGEEETMGELFERLSHLGADCLIEGLELMVSGNARFIKQDHSKATHSKIIVKTDAKIDWTKTPIEIKNLVRAFNPAPVAYCDLNGQPLKVYKVSLSNGVGEYGQIIDSDKKLEVACKDGSIIIERLQKAGGKQMDVKDFLAGNKLTKDSFLG